MTTRIWVLTLTDDTRTAFCGAFINKETAKLAANEVCDATLVWNGDKCRLNDGDLWEVNETTLNHD